MDECPLSSLVQTAEQSLKTTERGARGTTPVAEPEGIQHNL